MVVVLLRLSVRCFLFKQKTAYEMRISDWSSDVCSSDLDPLDAAVLDINLNGEMVFPLAETLRRRGVPFVFMTGYEGGAVLPPSLQDAPCVSKPLRESEFVAVLSQAIMHPQPIATAGAVDG